MDRGIGKQKGAGDVVRLVAYSRSGAVEGEIVVPVRNYRPELAAILQRELDCHWDPEPTKPDGTVVRLYDHIFDKV